MQDYSHIPRSRVDEFLRGFHAAIEPGAKVVFLDNRFVPGAARRLRKAMPKATPTRCGPWPMARPIAC